MSFLVICKTADTGKKWDGRKGGGGRNSSNAFAFQWCEKCLYGKAKKKKFFHKH